MRRLVVITNLGNNTIKTNIFSKDNKSDKRIKNVLIKTNNENDSGVTNLKENNINLISSEKDIVVKVEERPPEKKQNIIIFEDNAFITNMTKDYLLFEKAILYDRRDICDIFIHFIKIKIDLINIFNINYSFVPYIIRLIKFVFFFHFLFYIETLCIGQKYYFDKYYSKEFQQFLKENYFYEESDNYINNYINYIFSKKSVKKIEYTKIHFLYTFKYAFPRVLIPSAISLISYIITSYLTPRRKIMKVILNKAYKRDIKLYKFRKTAKKYRNRFLFVGILALCLMIFFFYSTINYFYVFEEAKYDITQSFILSGLLRVVFDFLFWGIIAGMRVFSIRFRFKCFYNLINKISEIN